jgi:hypothetical protein
MLTTELCKMAKGSAKAKAKTAKSVEDEFDIGPQINSNALPLLQHKLGEAAALQEQIETLEADLKAAKASNHQLTTVEIPELMGSMNMDALDFEGWHVAIRDHVSGSLPKDETARAEAIKLLESYGAGDLIKTTVAMEFTKEERETAKKVFEFLQGRKLDPSMSEGIHPQTLGAFLRERLQNGEPVDGEALGLFVGKQAKFTKTQARKGAEKKGKKNG